MQSVFDTFFNGSLAGKYNKTRSQGLKLIQEIPPLALKICESFTNNYFIHIGTYKTFIAFYTL